MLPLGSARGSAARVRRRARRAPACGTRRRTLARPPRAGAARVERGAVRVRGRRRRARVGRRTRLGRARLPSLLPLRRAAHRAAARRRLAADLAEALGRSGRARLRGARRRDRARGARPRRLLRQRHPGGAGSPRTSCRRASSRSRPTRSARWPWSSSPPRRSGAGRSATRSSSSAWRSRPLARRLPASAWRGRPASLWQRFLPSTLALLRLRADYRHNLHLTDSL